MSAPAAAEVQPRAAFLPAQATAFRVGVGGILLGVIAFWVALPPIQTRSVVWPIVLGAVAVAAGGWAVAGGQRRIGWGAVASGLLGIIGGVLATRAGAGHIAEVFVWGALLAAALRYATPLTFAALGGMFSERSGVVNIALEGMMLSGAFFGIWGADKTGWWFLGLLIAAASGAAFAAVHALFAIHLRADQVVGGTAINFLALGLTGYLFIQIYGDNGTPSLTSRESIPDVKLHWVKHIPPARIGHFLDDAIGQLNLMIWVTIALLFVSYVVMFRTPIGLRIRSVGEHPRAADTVGISVYRTRYGAVILSGILASLGGAYLSIGFVHSFNQNMTEGRGFIGLAALIFGRWRPFGAFGAALLFGFSSALAQRFPPAFAESSVSILRSGTLFQALPYILTLVAVAGVIGRSVAPAASGRPYKKQ